MKHPKTKAGKKNRPQDSSPRVAIYMRVGSASQLENQSLKQQIARFGFIRGTMNFMQSGK
jgi:predicted site-specific integrase-resolvase